MKIRDKRNRVLIIRQDRLNDFLNEKANKDIWNKTREKANMFRKNMVK